MSDSLPEKYIYMQDKYQNDSMLQYSKESHEIKLSTEVGVATQKSM